MRSMLQVETSGVQVAKSRLTVGPRGMLIWKEAMQVGAVLKAQPRACR
jgi:hypothetical protein